MLPGLALNDISIDDVSAFFETKAEVHVLRLDKISPIVSGNKWFKLRYYIDEAKAMRKKGILTFGGAWSNHIIATAAACYNTGLRSIGIIRGEEPRQLSTTLTQAREYDMQLVFVSRSAYQRKEMPGKPGDDYLIVKEGGYGETGAKGASTILDHCEDFYTHYCCAIGTGTMLAGIINRLLPAQQAIGISVLKNNTDLHRMVQALVIRGENDQWRIIHDYSFGGYARHDPALLRFMNTFYHQTGIPSDFVYTGKLFFAISDLLGKNYFPEGSKILLIHSGGLQGNTSLPPGTLMF